MAGFNPQSTVASFGAITIQGPMDGEWLSIKYQEAGVELHVGTQGFATFVENANLSGMAKVTLSQESPTNRELSLAYAAKTKAVFQAEDLSNGTLAVGAETRISEHAEIKRGNKIVGVEWTFLIAKLEL